MKIDKDKANRAIDEYIADLRDPNRIPRQTVSLYRTKFLLEKHGVIPDARTLDVEDHCSLFAACIAICRRVGEVSRIEIEEHAVSKGKSLAKTIRHWKSGGRSCNLNYVIRFRQHLADNA